jgi:hypothetical protein
LEHAVKTLYAVEEEGEADRGRMDQHKYEDVKGEEEGDNHNNECGQMGFNLVDVTPSTIPTNKLTPLPSDNPMMGPREPTP